LMGQQTLHPTFAIPEHSGSNGVLGIASDEPWRTTIHRSLSPCIMGSAMGGAPAPRVLTSVPETRNGASPCARPAFENREPHHQMKARESAALKGKRGFVVMTSTGMEEFETPMRRRVATNLASEPWDRAQPGATISLV
jgi:hypothetical protein